MTKRVDLEDLLLGQQAVLLASLDGARSALQHPVSKGTANEVDWCSVLDRFLPNRYQVGPAFVIDADGEQSDQIDVVVYDPHFCPLFFEHAGQRLIPVESVFAVFEVRPKLNRPNITYAGGKVASVRRLRRTDGVIVDRGQARDPRGPFDIIGGLLAVESAWSPPVGEPLRQALADLPHDARLDYACALRGGSVEASYDAHDGVTLDVSQDHAGLMFFLLRLYRHLQAIGSPMVIDLDEYARSLEVPTNGGGRSG